MTSVFGLSIRGDDSVSHIDRQVVEVKKGDRETQIFFNRRSEDQENFLLKIISC